MSIFLIIVLAVWILSLSRRIRDLEQARASSHQAASQSQHSVAADPASLAAYGATAAAMPPVASVEPEEKEDGEFVWAKYLARAGVAAILLGVAFFLKLAIDNNWIGIMGRVAIGVIVGLTGLILGQFLRSKYKGYSDTLIGGGLAVLYVTVFFAHSYYGLIGSPVALGLMVGITALAVMMSVMDKAEGLARLGIIGGFLAPILISTGRSGIFDLMTYALVLDLGVLVTAFSQKWHRLNFIAFGGTFLLYSIALLTSFESSLRMPVLLYTTVFFALFLAVSVMHHIVRKEKSDSFDVVFLTLNAIWYGVAVYGLMAPVAEAYLGFFMLGIAVIYAATALVSFTVDRSDRMLNQYLTGLCVVFLTAAIPMQFDGTWITIMWFMEAVILFSIDYSLKGKNLYGLGSVVFGLGLFRYFAFDSFERVDVATFTALLNARFAMLCAIIATALALGYIVMKAASTLLVSAEEGVVEKDLKGLRSAGKFFFVVANLLSIYLITSEVSYHYAKQLDAARRTLDAKTLSNNQYYGNENAYVANAKESDAFYKKEASLDNRRNVSITIAWAIYATALLVFGFMRKSKGFRISGLAFIFITLFKVFIDIWNFGGIYRVIGAVAVGIVALAGSFLYAKYKDRIKGALIASIVMAAVITGAGSALALAPLHADAATGDVSSKYVAPIITGGVTGSIMLDIPSDVLSKTTIDDIRVYDSSNAVVPYVALDGRSELSASVGAISAAVSNSTVRGGESTAVLDIGQVGVIHNSVSLDLSGPESYTRKVSIYGSDSALDAGSSEWRLITSSGYVYSYSDGRAGLFAKNSSVAYPKNSSRYLKVVLSSDSEKASISISGARISPVPPAYGIRDAKTVTLVPAHVSVFDNVTEKSTEITIDLGSTGIYSNQVTVALSGADQQFMRRAVVQHVNSLDGNLTGENWAMLGEATLFNIKKPLFQGSNLTIAYPEVKSRFIRVVVFNKDDQPVSFSKNAADTKIESMVRSILFDAVADKGYSMYFGNPAAAKPQYDFASIRAYEAASPASATLGAVSENKGYVAPAEAKQPWGEHNRAILNAALVLCVIVFAAIVYVYVRKTRVPGPESGDIR